MELYSIIRKNNEYYLKYGKEEILIDPKYRKTIIEYLNMESNIKLEINELQFQMEKYNLFPSDEKKIIERLEELPNLFDPEERSEFIEKNLLPKINIK